MNSKDFKILMEIEETESGNQYCVYNTKTKSIIKLNEQNFEKDRKHIVCSDSTKRKNGNRAILYSVQPNRYITVDTKGYHHFRTIKEVKYEEELYFNAIVRDNELIMLDGTLYKATNGWVSFTYIEMFRQKLYSRIGHNKVKFYVDDTSGEATLKEFIAKDNSDFIVPNFVTSIDSYCFCELQIGTLNLGRDTKWIYRYAVNKCKIQTLCIKNRKTKILSKAFNKCTIDNLEITVGTEDIFNECMIGTLDLSMIGAPRFNEDIFKGILKVDTIILPNRLKLLNVDNLPKDTSNIKIGSKAIELKGSNKNLIDKIKEELASGNKKIKLR